MGKKNSTSFSDFVAEKERKATPKRLAQMKETQKHMALLHAENFGISTQLANLRKGLKLTQEELSELTGVKQPEISKIENGGANPTQDTLVKLGMGLGAVLAFVPVGQIENFA